VSRKALGGARCQSGRSICSTADRSAGSAEPAPAPPVVASQRQNPGSGERVTNVLREGSSRLRSSATCLIRKLPNEMPRSPRWQFEIE
jgi:hypothetical protein